MQAIVDTNIFDDSLNENELALLEWVNSRLSVAKENLNAESEVKEDLYMAKNLGDSFKTGVRLLILLEVKIFC